MSWGTREGGLPGILRTAGLTAELTGAVGSLGLMLYASRHQDSRILLLLFAAWVISPFIAAAVINLQRWPALTRATLNVTTLVITLGSLANYGDVAFGQTKAKLGFVFLMVPLASWLLITVFVPIAELVSRRQTR